jgi:hypothetical protein
MTERSPDGHLRYIVLWLDCRHATAALSEVKGYGWHR